MKPSWTALAFSIALATTACSDEALKAEGQTCNFSADCADGLFCDLQARPSVCVRAGQPRDLTVVPADASMDLSAVD